MAIPAKSLIPQLLEQVFNKYADQLDKCSSDKQRSVTAAFFVQLEALVGDTLERALHILDDRIITLYYPEKRERSLAEITGRGRNSLHAIKLLPHINYCGCDIFTRHVLQSQLLSSPLSSSSLAAALPAASSRYTCEHVLALRLASVLRPPVTVREEVLSHKEFNLRLGHIMQPTCD